MTPQRPIPSGFGPATTAQEAIGKIRLDGKLAIVTGGYAGIGLETTRVLASAGARVIVPARDLPKARAALGGVANVVIDEMDLARPATIDAFAARVIEPVHLLINDAGSLKTIAQGAATTVFAGLWAWTEQRTSGRSAG